MGYVVKMYDEDWNVASYNLKVDNDYIIAAGITLAIGVMILVMALLNFFNFLVSFFYTRIAEYSVRKVFGSTCKQLFLQLYAHVALMLVLSALLMFSLIEIFGDSIRISLPILEMELDFGRPQLMEHSLQYIVLLFAASAVICWFILRRCIRISFSIHLEAYVANLMFLSGQNVLTDLIRPIVPIDTKSSILTPELSNFFAM